MMMILQRRYLLAITFFYFWFNDFVFTEKVNKNLEKNLLVLVVVPSRDLI